MVCYMQARQEEEQPKVLVWAATSEGTQGSSVTAVPEGGRWKVLSLLGTWRGREELS